ncbi:serine palmitoyltransferase small subunit family protein [Aspergillus ibericus CBS 121593]|uniref:Uncharacterized protein n=1 Tax=Aspergillus ibericus CBS 121593 TaxID=1448316 RepID=A0A395HAC0_9EURO|nr:hypothetical protein BO80DRAFT_209083 [Aspergillus ibericus CBS 121593]RAL04802.1 hypothetical protein BO80DRAFT_209083 [Aspergillus ibericus CBS 121593]
MATEMQSFYTPTTTHISSHAPAAVDELINKYSSTMTTSTSPGASHLPMKNPRRNIVQRFADRILLEYYRYEVTFGLYVMTPGEKLVANTFVIVVLSLLFWALLVYFPALLYQKLSRLVWLLTGHSSEEMGAALGILESHVNTISTPSS